TYFGLLSAGIAIALKDILTNFAGWIFILIKRPFEAGDRVEIGDYCGDVIDLRVFQFTLLELGKRVDAEQSTGRIVHIPNSFVFLKAQINFNKGFTYIWNEIPVLITFESNWQKAKRILERFLNKQDKTITETAKKKVMQSAKKYLIFYNKLTPIVYTSVKDSGILLTARYLCDPKKKRITEQNFWENILKSFAKNKDIDLAYPTQRIYMPKIKKK
ncbi:MAG TPA: mechanosensitive ion channel family protein, partial [Spirochaetota bacterium]|nr:mechanosensitive ion channel family protein [Spirochaetota bacterium]